jgi:hypothetical protein
MDSGFDCYILSEPVPEVVNILINRYIDNTNLPYKLCSPTYDTGITESLIHSSIT